jgi:hypothetical protein
MWDRPVNANACDIKHVNDTLASSAVNDYLVAIVLIDLPSHHWGHRMTAYDSGGNPSFIIPKKNKEIHKTGWASDAYVE